MKKTAYKKRKEREIMRAVDRATWLTRGMIHIPTANTIIQCFLNPKTKR